MGRCCATALDTFDSTVGTAAASGSVVEETAGTYTITYTSEEDYDGNAGIDTRTVTVEDTIDPEIQLIGDATQTITEGESYTDPGATATDGCDSNVAVTSTGRVDTTTPGTYTITYTATDDSDNSSSASRTVTVTAVEVENEAVTVRTNGKYVSVFVGESRVARKQIRAKKVAKAYRKLKVGKLYKKKQYQTVTVVTVGKRNAAVTTFRLTTDHQLTKKTTRRFAITGRKHTQIFYKPKSKQIVVRIGKDTRKTIAKYALTKRGVLRKQ